MVVTTRTQYQHQTFGAFKQCWNRAVKCSKDLPPEAIHALHVVIHAIGFCAIVDLYSTQSVLYISSGVSFSFTQLTDKEPPRESTLPFPSHVPLRK
ncbi:hypothetical protein AVEN_151256-1 [Araneus ventricosus]|uniref:Uncharacterized protein n=1 Tax=Araneus ventricosus TaxID=182803 RepID=A0A4Y2V0S3_ARAVE|nr:hypothetical protein AVEN_151256-1 [Araneus ventricosus]